MLAARERRCEAHGAEHEADEDQQQKRAEGAAGLLGVHEGEEDAGENGSDDHGGHGPLGVAVLSRAAAGRCVSLLGSPVVGGAERGKKKAAEGHLLKERREGDAEGEEDPGGAGHAEDAVDGRVGGAGMKLAVDHGQEEAEDGGADEVSAALERCARRAIDPRRGSCARRWGRR